VLADRSAQGQEVAQAVEYGDPARLPRARGPSLRAA
jgi:hypothetical protein